MGCDLKAQSSYNLSPCLIHNLMEAQTMYQTQPTKIWIHTRGPEPDQKPDPKPFTNLDLLPDPYLKPIYPFHPFGHFLLTYRSTLHSFVLSFFFFPSGTGRMLHHSSNLARILSFDIFFYFLGHDGRSLNCNGNLCPTARALDGRASRPSITRIRRLTVLPSEYNSDYETFSENERDFALL